MKQDPSFKLVAIVILAGVVTAFVAPELDSKAAPETHAVATAE
jgi:FlaG/FlaF family flagellin (archaellin)